MPDEIINPIRIFILDPYALIRTGLRLIIEGEPGMEVVGEAGDSTAGLEMVARQKPDLILLKLNHRGDPDLEVIPQLMETCPRTRIILLTTIDDFHTCSQAIDMGVLGIVSKVQPQMAFLKAIKKVHDGEVWIDHSMMVHLIKSRARTHRTPLIDPETESIKMVSKREREVIQLIGRGLKNKQIADQLCIRETTVRHHLTSVYGKLGVSDRLELLVFALRHKLA